MGSHQRAADRPERPGAGRRGRQGRHGCRDRLADRRPRRAGRLDRQAFVDHRRAAATELGRAVGLPGRRHRSDPDGEPAPRPRQARHPGCRSWTSQRASRSASGGSIVEHPKIGQVVLEQAGALRDAASIVLHHHEWFNGRGYPHGLAGAEIPIGSRIVAIADAYEAMLSDRPYKPADHPRGGARRAASPARDPVRPGARGHVRGALRRRYIRDRPVAGAARQAPVRAATSAATN